MYKYDFHAHTAEVSPCGQMIARDSVKLYKDEGYDGVVITDHYFSYYFEELGNMSWEDKIKNYLSGYYKAKEAGYEHDVDIFLGMELRFTEEGMNDFLVYGFDEEFLLANPKLYEYSLAEFNQLKDKHDLLIYQAHPYRDGCGIVSADLLDGVEVYNANPRHNSRNHLALEFAKDNDLLMLSGSDTHQPEDVGRGGVISEQKIEGTGHVVEVIKNIEENNLIRNG